MYRYVTFGLGIHSALALPELKPWDADRDAAPDVLVRFGDVEMDVPETLERQPFVQEAAPRLATLYWDFVGRVRVEDGRLITVDPLPGVEADVLALAVQGVAMGVLLHQRGLLTLHASAVSIQEEIVAFIGWKGAGKSTTAAALHAHGHPLVTDDVLAIAVPDGSPDRPAPIEAFAGITTLKLWPDAVAASFGDDPEDLPEIHRDSVKRFRRAEPHGSDGSLPLRCIYVLDYDPGDGADISIRTLPQSEAFVEVVRHSYAQRFLENKIVDPMHFKRCTQLVRQVPVRALKRKASLQRLDEIVRCIEDDVMQLRGASVPG